MYKKKKLSKKNVYVQPKIKEDLFLVNFYNSLITNNHSGEGLLLALGFPSGYEP